MNKILLLMAGILLCCTFSMKAQNILFEETFESYISGGVPTSWTIQDRINNEPHAWRVLDGSAEIEALGFSGQVIAAISSDISDNLLGTFAISLPSGSSYNLSFQIGIYTGTGNFAANNHYAVYVLPSGSTFMGTETPVFEEDITTGDIAVTKNINLTGFAGQEVKIYFRQFVNNQAYRFLLLDTVSLSQGTLGVSEAAFSSPLGIYPNPTSDYVYIKSQSLINNAKVFDMNGKVLPVHSDKYKIDVRTLLPGAYIVNIESGGKTSSHKFIKK